jgi:8-hydroxy-5-deazaflavin:NADPH oxidoreductase
MNIGVLGTGVVGKTIGTKLVQLDHDVMLGSRDTANPGAVAWAKAEGRHASVGSFANAAEFGEILFNCVHGAFALQALQSAGAENLKDKVLIDLSNSIDRETGQLAPKVTNTDSLGEQLQRAFPDLRVIKTLNTVNCGVMVDPAKLKEATSIFVSGNNIDAKATVISILRDWFGWKSIIDLGDITTARGVEMYALLWGSLRRVLPSMQFNIKVVTS